MTRSTRGRGIPRAHGKEKRENVLIAIEDLVIAWFRIDGGPLHFDLDVVDAAGAELVAEVDIEARA